MSAFIQDLRYGLRMLRKNFGLSLIIALSIGLSLGVILLLVAVAVAARFVPARRAAKIDPMIALKYE